jgi:hypothetical protein
VEVFTAREPKFTEVGEIASAGVALSPAPESGMVTGAFNSGAEITSEPEWSAAEGGAKTTLRSRWLPGANTTGVFAEESENPDPETCKLLRLMEFELELLIFTVCEFFWPTITALKSMTEGTTEIFAATGSAAELPAETEAQPEKTPENRIKKERRMAGEIDDRSDGKTASLS